MMRLIRKSDCDRASGTLSPYLDGYLAANDVAWLETHLSQCHRCSDELASLRATVSLLGQMPQAAARRSFLLRPRPAPVPVPVPAWGWRGLRFGTAMATILVVAVVTANVLGVVSPRPAASPAPPLPLADRALATPAAPAGVAGPLGAAGPADAAGPLGAPGPEAVSRMAEQSDQPMGGQALRETLTATAPYSTDTALPSAAGAKKAPSSVPTPEPTTPPVLLAVPTPGEERMSEELSEASTQTLPLASPTSPGRGLWPRSWWPAEAALIGVWLVLAALTAHVWRLRRKGGQSG